MEFTFFDNCVFQIPEFPNRKCKLVRKDGGIDLYNTEINKAIGHIGPGYGMDSMTPNIKESLKGTSICLGIGIYQSWQDQGYGSALIKVISEALYQAGYIVCLCCRKTNPRAWHVYNKAGFVCVPSVSEGEDALPMIYKYCLYKSSTEEISKAQAYHKEMINTILPNYIAAHKED